MNKQTITVGALVILGIVGLMLWGRSNQAASASASQQFAGESPLSASERMYDFGTIRMANGLVSKTFEITNPTDKDVNLESVTTSCMCTAAFIVKGESKRGPFGMPGHAAVPKANEIIKAGETRDIEVVYDPNAHGPAGVGLIDRLVYLTDSSGATLQLEIRANVIP